MPCERSSCRGKGRQGQRCHGTPCHRRRGLPAWMLLPPPSSPSRDHRRRCSNLVYSASASSDVVGSGDGRCCRCCGGDRGEAHSVGSGAAASCASGGQAPLGLPSWAAAAAGCCSPCAGLGVQHSASSSRPVTSGTWMPSSGRRRLLLTAALLPPMLLALRPSLPLELRGGKGQVMRGSSARRSPASATDSHRPPARDAKATAVDSAERNALPAFCAGTEPRACRNSWSRCCERRCRKLRIAWTPCRSTRAVTNAL